MKKVKNPEYILFDVGNVLVYKVSHEDENVAKLLNLTREEYRKMLDKIIEEQTKSEKLAFKNMNTVKKEKAYLDKFHKKICNYLEIDFNTKFINKMTNCRMKGDFALKENTISTLKILGKKYRLGIFSNALPSRRVHELKIGNLYKYFDHIFISKEIGLEKPDPKAYEYVLSEIGVGGDKIMFVDDKIEYLKGAAAAGIDNLILYKNKEISKQYPMIGSLSELIDLLNLK
jgi:HAD superfamily hydrolase (TIGR01509 family)